MSGLCWFSEIWITEEFFESDTLRRIPCLDAYFINDISFSKQVNYNEFEDFINTYDIDEALGSMLNKNGVDIDINRVQFVDVSQMTGQARKDGPKPVYRDYPTD